VTSSFTKQMGLLARRSVVRTLRDPGTLGPGIVVPLLLFAIVGEGLGDATKIKNFPTNSFITFALTIPFAQGAMMTMATTGVAITTDIENGFINRLVLTPLRGVALLSAQLAGALVVGVIQAAIFFGVGFAAGAHVKAGVLGALVLTALFLVAVLGFGALGILLGLWTGSGAAVGAIGPMSGVFLFLSSLAFPRNLITTDWFRHVATANPLSYLVEGFRSLLIEGWDKQALALGFLVAGVLMVVSIAISVVTLKSRLVAR
jgi:ABC-2 type transport system permease protein